MKRNKSAKPGKLRIALAFIFSFLFILLGLAARWGSATWGDLSMDELIFTLTQPLTGTGQGMIPNFIKAAVIPTIVIIVLSILLYRLAAKRQHAKAMLNIMFIVSCLVVCVFGYGFLSKLDIINYLIDQNTESTFIKDNYVNPKTAQITFPSKKRNLIYIYLESMEMTSSDKKNGGAFKQDVIPELTKLSKENENFSGNTSTLNGGYSLPGSTWTMGALFAQSSGLPLKTDLGQNAMQTQKTFFPSLTTLGDILAKQNYHQTFMIGSNGAFSGRSTYYKDHGNFDIEDYNAAIREKEIPSNYKVFWGYEDEKLFALSKQKLTKLAQSSQPFNFTMLTVDTHFPSGYKCRLCKNEFDSQYLNVMACSSRQVTTFVKWIQAQPWYQNTTIVINGDHPTMSKSYTSMVPSSYQRKTYTTYINAAVKPATYKRRTYATMDNFPTTLAALGATIKGNRLGLGTNLFSNTETLSEKYGYEKETQELRRTSSYLDSLEKVTDTTAAKEFYYNEAKKFGHKTLLEVKKVDGTKVTARITDFRHDKKIARVNLRASKNKSITPYISTTMKCLDAKNAIYEATIDVASLNTKKLYIEVSYDDKENINYPLARKQVTLK